jgi:hypothetical protein
MKESIFPKGGFVQLTNSTLLASAGFTPGKRYALYHRSEFTSVRLRPDGKYLVPRGALSVPWMNGDDMVVAIYSHGVIEIATDMLSLINEVSK